MQISLLYRVFIMSWYLAWQLSLTFLDEYSKNQISTSEYCLLFNKLNRHVFYAHSVNLLFT